MDPDDPPNLLIIMVSYLALIAGAIYACSLLFRWLWGQLFET